LACAHWRYIGVKSESLIGKASWLLFRIAHLIVKLPPGKSRRPKACFSPAPGYWFSLALHRLAFALIAKVADGSMFIALVDNFIETSLLKSHALNLL